MPRTAPNPATLEEAREMLLQQTNELNQLDEQIENLNSQSEENAHQIEELRTLNQKLFLRAALGKTEDEQDEPQDTETLEDFARNKLKGLIR